MRRNRQKDGDQRRRTVVLPVRRPSFSSYYSRSRAQTLEAQQDGLPSAKPGLRLRLLPTVIALVVIVGSILFSLTISTRPSVSLLDGQTSPYRPLEVYADETQRLLSQRFVDRTKLTVDTSAVERQLMERFPELNAAVLRLPVLGRRPTLVVDVKAPALVLVSPTRSIVVDSTGMALCDLKELDEKARVGLQVVEDQSGLAIEPGEYALPASSVKFIKESVLHLAEAKIELGRMVLPPLPNQLDLYPAGVPYFVKTDMGGNARLQLGSFLAVRKHLIEQGVTPAEYIDVRVEEKVFYK